MSARETVAREPRFRSLAAKFSWFTAILVMSVSTVELLDHWLRNDRFLPRHFVLGCVLVACAAIIAWVTSRVFIRPLVLLHHGMTSVKHGCLDPIRLSETGDEIEKLGESFNEMIKALAASRRQVCEHQQQLERKIQERTKALEESTQRAEAGSRAKSEFLANMSHELRTPLNGILGMLDIALDSELSSSQREDLETAKESALSLLALVNGILDLAKIEAGKLSLEKICFSPRKLVAGCCKSLALRAKQKGLAFTWEVEPSVSQYLLGDSLRLHQVLVNLLGNAIKYTHRGSVRLGVSARPAPAPGSVELRIDVVDSGIGIPQEKLSSIFEKFTQADGSITRRYGGTGLGLAICKELVRMHGGRIWVESEVGRGSAFHVEVELPETAPLPQEDSPTEGAEAASSGQDRESTAGPRILVVEDNPTNQKVVTGLLSKRGYQTVLAGSGRQALDALEQAPIDLVLMDLQMPVMDGLQATRLMRQDARWRALPIIGLTAYAMADDRQRCLDAGMNDYLAKPVRPATLLEKVAKYAPLRGCPRAAEDPASGQPQMSHGLDVVSLGEQVH